MRRQVVEIQCDRCQRVETVPLVVGVDLAAGPDSTALVVALMVDGKSEIQFTMEALCTPCTKTVRNHLQAIRKPIKGASPNRQPVQPLPLTPLPSQVHPLVDLGAKKKAQGRP